MSDTSTTATIRKLLIANRGEIASRIMRTARAMGIATVAVFSDADEDAPFVADADEAVRLPGNTPAETYLRSDLVVEAARRTGADAVHPGYGFLSENAEFARACGDAGLVFVGPSPRAIELMGSKLEAKRIMTEVGVPVLPTAVVDGAMTAAELAAAGESIGFPVLVKAAFGGGGRGMRVVEVPGDLAEAVGAAQREAAAAFGDGTTFLEPYLRAPRHVEVQILGDTHGTVTHLFERECSIQRRHQKIVEESPSPAVDDALRAEMCEAALGAGKAIGYVGAGTVEFVLDAQGRFFFLEVNTRLQVEHPVTEMITGLDLVELQLRVAQGEALPIEVLDATMSGHAIEARLYAEDVAAGFLPVSGTIDRLRVPAGDAVRIDTGYDDGSVVSPFYDSMLAKVIAWAPTRTVAALRLARALEGAQLHGVETNRNLLVGVLRDPEFLAGATDTGFLDRRDLVELSSPVLSDAIVRLHAVAALLADRAARRSSSPLPAGIPAGWRNVGPADQPVRLKIGARALELSLRVRRDATIVVIVDGDTLDAHVRAVSPDGVDVELDGRRATCTVQGSGSVRYVDSPLGATTFVEMPRFPEVSTSVAAGSLLSPMPGVVRRVDVGVGDPVAEGATLVTIEAMKMEHAIRSPHAGVVTEVRVAEGDQVETGSLLAIVTAEGGPDAGTEPDRGIS